jgi:hypothetical protein
MTNLFGTGWFATRLAKNVEVRGIPHLEKNQRDAPNFLHVAMDKTACAPFFRGKAQEVRRTHEARQEIGDVGHPGLVAGRDILPRAMISGQLRANVGYSGLIADVDFGR